MKSLRLTKTKTRRLTVKNFFPKTLHPFHIFESESALYAADLEKARVVELSDAMREMLKFAETRNDAEIRQTLGKFYTDDDILEAFERFKALWREGLLFNRGECLRTTFVTEGQRQKLLVAIPGIAVDSFFDIALLSAGTNMALSQIFPINLHRIPYQTFKTFLTVCTFFANRCVFKL